MNPKKSNQTSHTHIRRFKSGIEARGTLQESPFAWRVEWSARPVASDTPEYYEWRDAIFEEFARRTGRRVLLVTV